VLGHPDPKAGTVNSFSFGETGRGLNPTPFFSRLCERSTVLASLVILPGMGWCPKGVDNGMPLGNRLLDSNTKIEINQTRYPKFEYILSQYLIFFIQPTVPFCFVVHIVRCSFRRPHYSHSITRAVLTP
jgi:hypothetical protein